MIKRTNVDSALDPGSVDELSTITEILEESWEFVQPAYMCFVDL